MTADALRKALAPVLTTLGKIDPSAPGAIDTLNGLLPIDGPAITEVRTLLRGAIAAGAVADREAGGIRFSRLQKANGPDELSIDVVHMDRPGPGHTHPNGEIDLCFAVSGDPRFDGRLEGWTVYAAGTWHIPTVAGGAMDILYFLPGGAIEFGPKKD